jgi:HEAT repeat protein
VSDSLEALRAELAAGDEERRRLAVATLAPLAELDSAAALRLALDALGDESWRVRKEAVQLVCAWPEPGAVVAPLMTALATAGNAGLRNAAAEALCRLGETVLEALVGQAARADADTRKFVVEVLGRIGSTRGVPVLLARLGDDDPNVRGAAAEALGAIGGTDAERGLRAVLDRDDHFTRACALSALARLGAHLPLAELRVLHGERMLRREVLAALGRCGDPAAVDLLVADVAGGPASTREVAAVAVVELATAVGPRGLPRLRGALAAAAAAGPGLVEGLARMLQGPRPDARRAAALVLGWAGAADQTGRLLDLVEEDPEAEEAVTAAIAVLGHAALPQLRAAAADPRVSSRSRTFAIQRLCDLSDAGAVPLLLAGLQSDDPGPVAAAAAALGVLGDATAVAPLLRALARDDGSDAERGVVVEALVALAVRAGDAVRAALVGDDGVSEVGPAFESIAGLRLLGEVGGAADLALAERGLHATDRAVRRAAVAAVARVAARTGASVVPTLRLALADEDPAVRAAAAAALGRAGAAAEASEALRHALADEVPEVRAAAAAALGRLGDVAAVESLRALTGDPAGVLAVAAVEALARLAPDDPGPFELALRHPDPEVLKAALAAVAGGAGGPGGGAGEARVRREVFAALGYPRWDVRRAAAEASARFGASAEPWLRERLQAEADPLVRATMEAALERARGAGGGGGGAAG